MIEYTMTFGHGTASIARGVDDIIAFAQYNCPSNIEIIVANNDMGLDVRAPFYIFKDNSTNKQEYKFAISLDDVIDTFREYGLNADGTKFNTYENVYKIATINSVNNICKGQFFVSDEEANRCPTKKELSFATASDLKNRNGIYLNNGNNYNENQIVKLDDLNKRTVLPLSYYIKNHQSTKIDHSIVLRCYFSTNGSNFTEFDSIWLGSELSAGGLLNNVWYVDLNKIPNFDPGKNQYYIRFFCEGTKYKQDWRVSHIAYNGETYNEKLKEEIAYDHYNKWSGTFVLQPRKKDEEISYFTCKDRKGYVVYGIAWHVS